MAQTEAPTMTRPESLRGQIENFLREAIMSGRFKPGERLVERELCELLSVSRPPLREALRRLEAEKLVEIVTHRGPVVASLDIEEARELYAVRAMLEGYAAREFATRATDEQISQMGEKVRALKAVSLEELPDRKTLISAKAQIYEVMLANCGNRLIGEILNGLLTRINLLRATSFSRPQRLAESLDEIERLYSLIQQRDAHGAQEMAITHIQNAENAAMEVVSSHISPQES